MTKKILILSLLAAIMALTATTHCLMEEKPSPPGITSEGLKLDEPKSPGRDIPSPKQPEQALPDDREPPEKDDPVTDANSRDQSSDMVFFPGNGFQYRSQQPEKIDWIPGSELDILVYSAAAFQKEGLKFEIPASCTVISFDWDNEEMGLLHISGSYRFGSTSVADMLSKRDRDGLQEMVFAILGRKADRYIALKGDSFGSFVQYVVRLQAEKGINADNPDEIFSAAPALTAAMMERPLETLTRVRELLQGVETDISIGDIVSLRQIMALRGMRVNTGHFPHR